MVQAGHLDGRRPITSSFLSQSDVGSESDVGSGSDVGSQKVTWGPPPSPESDVGSTWGPGKVTWGLYIRGTPAGVKIPRTLPEITSASSWISADTAPASIWVDCVAVSLAKVTWGL